MEAPIYIEDHIQDINGWRYEVLFRIHYLICREVNCGYKSRLRIRGRAT